MIGIHFGIHFGWVFIFVLFLNMCFGCFVFWCPIDFGTLNLPNAKSSSRKTNNYLNLPFLKQLETIMISGSILASFRQPLTWFSWVVRYLIYHWIVHDFWHRCWLHGGTLLAYIGILFASSFQFVAFVFGKGCFWRCLLSSGTLLAPFWFPLGPRLTPLGFVLGSPFGFNGYISDHFFDVDCCNGSVCLLSL